jgi:pimeloyl-ACP methyl ester carboxylesterase
MNATRRKFSALVIVGLFALMNLARADYFTFWANKNFDRSVYSSDDGANIDDSLNSIEIAKLPAYQQVYDCDYVNASGQRVIPSKRDLQDFTRLWMAGVNELVKVLPTNSTLTLSWTSVTGEPAIDLFTAIDPGIGYQTNAAIAAAQIDPVQCPYLGRISPTHTVQFTKSTWRTNQFIFCGCRYGAGGLTLTIADGNGQQLVQTTTWIQIVDIKQMFERWTVGDTPTIAPYTNAIIASDSLGKLPDGTLATGMRFTPPQDTTTPYILFVHGWNMRKEDKYNFAETAFKRLYWQGYQGRFGSFQWPTGFGFSGIISAATDSRNYDNSESNAWASATGLLNKLNDLNVLYPGHVYLLAHSMGNVVAGEAMRQAGNNQAVNTYIAMQGAVPAHCYDPSTVNRSTYSTPDRYAHYWADSSPSYFSASAGAGTYLDFYNPNDYALGWWNVDQSQKPDNGVLGIGINYPGYFYSSSSGFYKIAGAGTNGTHYLNFTNNTHEIFAYCDPSWSYAIGAQADVSGAFNKRQVNLQSVWITDPLPHHDYSSHFWHSAEFRSDYPSQVNFWITVLGSQGFKLK